MVLLWLRRGNPLFGTFIFLFLDQILLDSRDRKLLGRLLGISHIQTFYGKLQFGDYA